MALNHIPLESINESILQELIENRVPEDKTIDYKESLSLKKPTEKEKFLKHITAFANTAGGHIIYGMKEKKAIPTDLCGLTVDDFDTLKQTIENLIRDCVEPRLWGVLPQQVELANSKVAVVIRIPRSFNSPHMVKSGGHRAFYGRSSASSDFLDVGQLRQLFLLSNTIGRQIRDFRDDRIAIIARGDTPVQLLCQAKIVLHIVPFDSFSLERTYDLSIFDNPYPQLPNIGWKVHDGRFNFEGYYSRHGYNQGSEALATYSYTQIFRNGIIEAVYNNCPEDLRKQHEKKIYINYEKQVLAALRELLTFQKSLGVSPPLFALLTFINIKDYKLSALPDPLAMDLFSVPFDRDVLKFSEVMFETFDCDVDGKMRYVFDRVRNSAGLPPTSSV
ncbi:MAG: ATP-binding protein [Sedimentisphaerales bacterium]